MNTTGPIITHPPRLGRAAVTTAALALLVAACASDDDPGSSTSDDDITVADSALSDPVEDEATTETDDASGTSTDDETDDDEPVDRAAGPPDVGAAAAYDPATASLEFDECGSGFQCAMFPVPLDYDDPSGDTVEVHVTRQEARGERVGTLFLNPGGPGFGAEDMVRGIGQFGPPALVDSFDLIGIDPRGTGRSGAIDCNTDDDADALRRLSFGPTDLDEYLVDFEELAATCEANYDTGYLASITTVNAARDMESVRIALGDEPLDYLGASYGTAIGSVYATMYPDSIRTMILDAAVPTDPVDGTFESRAAEVEQALVRLDTSCDLWLDCPVRDVGFLAAIEQVRATLEADGNIGNLDATTFNSAINLLVPVPVALIDVAEGLDEALAGRGSLLAQIGAEELISLPDSESLAANSGATQAIVCADGWNMENSTADELAGQVERTAALAPNAGPGWETPCDLWPVTGPGIPAVSYTGDAPILVIGGEADAITPLRWSEDLVAELGPNASLLIGEESGHTKAFQRPGCIDDHVFTLLFDGELPESGTRCGVTGLIGIGYADGTLVIDRVTTGSPAEAAGLQLGDEVVEADGSPANDWMDVPPGDFGEALDLIVDRDGELIEFSVVRGPAFWEMWRVADDAETTE
ncbi:MAG: alpha/beta fold hydrolase [Actinomycetota bacterium]